MNNDIKYLEKITNYNDIQNQNNFVYKQIFKSKMKELFLDHIPLSNMNERYCYKSNFQYFFDYQRYDAVLEYNDFFENFYGIKDFKTKTIFTNSGMAAINSIINTLTRCTNSSMDYAKDIYFETQKLLKIIRNSKTKAKTKILWLDSISYKFDFSVQEVDKYEIIVIDTTCFHPHLFIKMIGELNKANKLCILIRSHTKLDMLGLEYCSLGSLTFVLPSKLINSKWQEYKKMLIFCLEYIGSSGLGVTEYNVFPLLNDTELIKLNKARIERIRDNNLKAYAELSLDNKFIIPNHKLFFLLNLKTKKNIEELKHIVLSFCINNSSICCFSPSFGFDYIAIDTYYDYDMKGYTIRISVGDVNDSTQKKFVEKFQEFLNDTF